MSDPKPLPDLEELERLFRLDRISGRLYWASGREVSTRLTDDGYVRIHIRGKSYPVHRVIWKMINGREPETVDHRDRRRAHNEPGNLREADRSSQSFNKQKKVFWGIEPRKCGYRVRVSKSGRRINGGTHTNLSDAVQARDKLAVSLHGEFA